MVVTYTSEVYLRDAYRCVTGAYGSLIAVNQDAWHLKGIRMCKSHRLDKGQAIQHLLSLTIWLHVAEGLLTWR